MTLRYDQYCSKVLLRFPDPDGRLYLAVKEAVNTAHKIIARVQTFDELVVVDKEHAFTEENVKDYHIENDLNLVRPKDIMSIKLMAAEQSRKLTYVPPRMVDEVIPYVEGEASDKSMYYTQRGLMLELIAPPDANYPLHITHSQWPVELVNDADLSSYLGIDEVIVSLAVAVTRDILDQNPNNREGLAKQLLSGAVTDDRKKPDQLLVAQEFTPGGIQRVPSQWWNNPFVIKDK